MKKIVLCSFFALVAAVSMPTPGKCQYLNATVSNEVRFNDRVAGLNGQPNLQSFVTGDTWACAWSNDGFEYCTFNDGTGLASTLDANPTTSNLGLVSLQPTTTQLSDVNAMPAYGTQGQTNTNGWTDGFTWKTAGIGAANGVLYLTVQRQLDVAPWTVGNASIIKSMDHGVTWCNSAHATATGCSLSDPNGDPPASGQAMWPSQFAGPTLVTYCQDNSMSCPSVDGNGNYFYLTSLGANYHNLYLLRVRKSDFPSLDITKYQYWVGGQAGGISNNANWSNSSVLTVPVLTLSSDKFQVYYISALSQYVLISDTEHGMFEVWNAASLSGPWVQSAILPADDEDANFPGLNLSSVVDLNTYPASVAVRMQYSGDYTTNPQGSAFPVSDSYSLHWKTLTLSSANADVQTTAAANFTDQLPSANLLTIDYAFLPELGNAITDYSGNQNTGTPASQITYTDQGVWLNQQNSNGAGDSISTNMTYSGDEFTMMIVFRKMQAPLDNECLFTASNGAFSLCRVNAASSDTYTLNISGQTATIDLLPDGSWNMLTIVRTQSVVSVYRTDSLSGSSFFASPAVSLTVTNGFPTITNFTLGSNFSGQIARFVLYEVGFSPFSLTPYESALLSDVNQRGIYLGRQIASTEYPLDFQPPLAAWSLRRLLTTYTGPAIKVIEVDGASTDIGFTASGNLDTSTLTNFCGNQSCYIAKWYDQSGNHFDLTSRFGYAHLAAIVNSGTVSTCGTANKPCVAFDGTEEYVTPSSFYFYGLTAAGNAVFEMNLSASGPWAEVLGFLDTANGANVDAANLDVASWLPILQYGTSSNLTWVRNGEASPGLGIQTNTAYSVFSAYDGYYQRLGVDGNFAIAHTMGFASPFVANSRLQFNTVALGAPGFVGSVPEAVLWGYSVPYQATRTFGNSQNSYFGTTQSWP